MKFRVLVVDDNPVSCELVREVLQSSGIEVVEAGSGLEALDTIRGSPPDLVLLDLRMPSMDGFSVLREIRQDPRLHRLRVLAFTAHAMRGDREKALAAGFDGYITKPIQAEVLRKQVGQFLLPRDGNHGIP
jgi:CheY-like chemotaxis protein